MPGGTHDVLLEAIARNAGAVLSLPVAGTLRHFKSRFLSENADGFWVEAVRGEQELIDSLIASQQPVGISFKSAKLKVVFASPIQRRQSGHRINATTEVEALLLPFPADVKTIQRRRNYRARVPDGAELSARCWRIPEYAYLTDKPAAGRELPCALRDISTGGVGVTFLARNGEPVKVTNKDRLRIELSHPSGKLLLEGRLRHPAEPPQGDQVRAGIQFKPLENNITGRKLLAQLTRIVGELQREEVRRMKLGLCTVR